MHADAEYRKLKELARDDIRVLGLVLGGSRGKGFEHQDSDFDLDVIVADDVLEHVLPEIRRRAPQSDVRVFTLSAFKEHAGWGSAEAWDRYNYVGLRVDPDRTNGERQRIVDEKALVPEGIATRYIDESLDWYINQTYRSLKGLRSGNRIAHRLDGAEAIRGLLQALFCLHGRRVLPYYKYLEWELGSRPLHLLGVPTDRLLDLLLVVLTDGDYGAQQALLGAVERTFRTAGHGRVFDEWGSDVPWMLNWSPKSYEGQSGFSCSYRPLQPPRAPFDDRHAVAETET